MFSFLSFTTLVFTVILSLGETTEWDYMVFSQSWPSTTCTDWKDKSPSHQCVLPKDKSHWIVHGLWPTKNGTEGPSYCPGAEFNKEALEPIEIDLEEDWTNVEVPTEHYSFWRHEWEKHGRCAGILPELNTELKYFKQGLAMLHKYNIGQILKGSEIVPGERLYSGEKIYSSMHSALGKIPSIHCLHERGTGKIFVHEIRICLDKNFQAIDCQGHDGQKVVNCGADPQEEVVHYPLTVPILRDFNFTPPSPHWLYKLFYILRLLVWFSL